MIDLRKPFNEPRSAHEQLGGVKLLGRIKDKGRATITGTLGPYYFFDCELDRVFFGTLNVSRDEFLEVLRRAYISRLPHNAEALADLREALASEPEISDETLMKDAQASDVDAAALRWLLDHRRTPSSVFAEINAAVDRLLPEAFIDRVLP